jgi:uncharacterized protein involved in response to NO
VSWREVCEEPFRLFFPLATLAGLLGVLLWPAMIWGWIQSYPGPSHARLMIHGFFGGFILGFMGTAMPRLVDSRPFNAREVGLLLTWFTGSVIANAIGSNGWGDIFFVLGLGSLFWLLRARCHSGKTQLPATFILVAFGFLSAIAGLALQAASRWWETPFQLVLLGKLLSYHAFILLAVMGAGGFLLPRFLGTGVRRKASDEAQAASLRRMDVRAAQLAAFFASLSYGMEALGWPVWAAMVRGACVTSFFCYHIPVERLRWSWKGVHPLLLIGLGCIPLGILLAAWFPGARVGLLHFELMGGFGLITLGVATRVVLGHSGGRSRLERTHPVLLSVLALVLLGLLSRVSGEFLPHIQMSHYLYAAFAWVVGLILWACWVLPGFMRPDPEG